MRRHFDSQATVVQERRRCQQPHETRRRGQPWFRVGPGPAKFSVEVPVQQARGPGGEVQQDYIAGLDD